MNKWIKICVLQKRNDLKVLTWIDGWSRNLTVLIVNFIQRKWLFYLKTWAKSTNIELPQHVFRSSVDFITSLKSSPPFSAQEVWITQNQFGCMVGRKGQNIKRQPSEGLPSCLRATKWTSQVLPRATSAAWAWSWFEFTDCKWFNFHVVGALTPYWFFPTPSSSRTLDRVDGLKEADDGHIITDKLWADALMGHFAATEHEKPKCRFGDWNEAVALSSSLPLSSPG